ncbi:ribosomal protein L28e [Lophiostoma macrostomum CBS 122681]|uniref:Ribosomal protein L28e n=1 Tax=Lophiostoma macrostomum CBS 122681 TaxID=1314788 RepID=A0A6A6SX30_9PLEO|nr:ribosomal protein L28e [Lophiostoma macrostomum CBS 122681]
MATLSSDLIWEVTRGNSSTLVKRKQAGGVQFSKDPLNLRNQYSRKYEGLVADKAIGILPAENGGITLITKKADKQHTPASALQKSTISSKRSTRKTYSSIVKSTTKKGYRPDLRKDAVARASAIRKSQQPVKEDKPAKLRGKKAQADS